jgi:superfamily II DNA or RNA helicase
MASIGANSLCPCGSGKKYKRCCRDNGRVNFQPKDFGKHLNFRWLLGAPLEVILDAFFEDGSIADYEKWLKTNLEKIKLTYYETQTEKIFTIEASKLEASIVFSSGLFNFTKGSIPPFLITALLHDILHSSKRIASLSPEASVAVNVIHSLHGKDAVRKVKFSHLLLANPHGTELVEEFGEVFKLHRRSSYHSQLRKPVYGIENEVLMKRSVKSGGGLKKKESLLDHLEFVFSDGSSYTLDEAYYNPYLYLLPNVFIDALTSSGWLYGGSCTDFLGYGQPAHYSERNLGLLFEEFLKNYSGKILFTDKVRTDNEEPERKFITLDSYSMLRGRDFVGHFFSRADELGFELKLKNELKDMVRKGNFYYSPERFSLSIHCSNDWGGGIENLRGIDFQKENSGKRGVAGSGMCVDFNHLASSLNHNNIKIDLSGLPELAIEDYTLLANLSTKNKSSIAVSEFYGHTNVFFYWVGRKYFYALNEGFGDIWHESNTTLAVQSGEKRKHDLKFLRHQGLYLVMMAELMKLYGQGQNKKKITASILTVAYEFYSGLSNKKSKEDFIDQEVLTSRKVDQLLKAWVSDILDDFLVEMPVFCKGSYYRASMGELAKRMCNFFLAVIKSKLDPKSLLKEKNIGFIIDFDENKTLRVISEDAFQSALGAMSADVHIFVDEKPVNVLSASQFQTSVGLDEANNDWFSLHPKVFFDGVEISMEEALAFTQGQFVEFKGKTYIIGQERIPSLQWLDYFWQKLGAKNKEKKIKAQSNLFHLPKSQILTLLAMKYAGIPVQGGERWREIEKNFEALTASDKALEIEKIRSTLPHIPLRPFQFEGILWLTQLTGIGLGAILADDMGLGKTLQALAFLSYVQRTKGLGPTLIVVPTSLIYNWQKECEKFTPELALITFDRLKKEELSQSSGSKIILATYGLLTEHPDFFQTNTWDYVIFDEAQNLKNIASLRTTEARKLEANHKIALTGTPMENHYGDFYSLIDLILPGALGDYASFNKRYIMSGPTPFEIDFLKSVTRPLIMRRQKKLILGELPDKTESIIKLDFEESQKEIYRDIAVSWNENIRDLIEQNGESKGHQVEMLTALLRLRQLCSYPQLVPHISYSKAAPKEKALLAQVQSIIESGESVLIFTHFKGTLDLITNRLESENIKTWSIHGSMSIKERKAVLTEFDRKESIGAVVMTLKTGGVGLNLTKASYVIHLEPWWNPAVENQATDRAHRMGQTKSVQVYRYLMKDSVEERMEVLKDKKKKAFDRLFDDAANLESTEELPKGPLKGGLSYADFEYLLGTEI